MGSEAETEYAKFEEKLKRSVYLDNLSPNVNESVIKTAFDQYANVTGIQFIPNYTEPDCHSKCAIVELENEKQANSILNVLGAWPFMMSGMPRPIRGRPAEPAMFEDRPAKPDRKIQLRWLDPKDPDFEVAQKMKILAKKHSAEQSFLLKKQLEEEEKLHKQQYETLKSHYQKYESMDSIMADGTVKRLAMVKNRITHQVIMVFVAWLVCLREVRTKYVPQVHHDYFHLARVARAPFVSLPLKATQ